MKTGDTSAASSPSRAALAMARGLWAAVVMIQFGWRARSRLAQFRADPAKHASYLAKVLLKFKLLELQRAPYTAFFAWSEDLSYLRLAHQEYAGPVSYKDWIRGLCVAMEKSGACAMDGDFIYNAG